MRRPRPPHRARPEVRLATNWRKSASACTTKFSVSCFISAAKSRTRFLSSCCPSLLHAAGARRPGGTVACWLVGPVQRRLTRTPVRCELACSGIAALTGRVIKFVECSGLQQACVYGQDDLVAAVLGCGSGGLPRDRSFKKPAQGIRCRAFHRFGRRRRRTESSFTCLTGRVDRLRSTVFRDELFQLIWLPAGNR
jgi:hypothetical protein